MPQTAVSITSNDMGYCSIRRTFLLVFILASFCTCMYFFAITNNKTCDKNHVFRFICKSFNSTGDAFHKVGKHVTTHIKKSFHKVKELISSPDEDTKEIDEIIEKYSKKLAVILNKTDISLTSVGHPTTVPLTSLLSTTTAAPVVKWIDTTEGKKYSDYGDGTCDDNSHRKTLTTIFKKWIEITAALEIPYFLSCGTLLGAWRNGDVIPYDTDIDVLIDNRHAVKLEKIQNKRNFSPYDGKLRIILQKDWRLPYDDRRRFACDGRHVPAYEGECSFQEPLGRLLKDGLHLDIFDYKIDKGKIYDPSEWKKEYLESDVFPLKKCRFLEQVTYCPKKPTAVLFEFYGNKIENLSPNTICRQGSWTKKDRRK